MKLLQKLAPYSFAITILWLGFVVAIGFIETPLRFQPERVSLDEALAIGRLVFHALNTAEIIFAVLLLLMLWKNTTRTIATVAVVVAGVLTIQSGLLFSVLDWRTDAILRGEEVPKAVWHTIYIGLDVLKIVLLVILATLQIRWFESRRETGRDDAKR